MLSSRAPDRALLVAASPRGDRRIALLAGAGLLLAVLAAVSLARHLELSIGLSLGLAALALACWVGAAGGVMRRAAAEVTTVDARSAALAAANSTARPADPGADRSDPAAAAAPSPPGLRATEWERQLLGGLPGRSFVVQPVREGALTDWLVLASHDTDPATPAPDAAATPELLSHWLARHPQHRPADVVQALQTSPMPAGPAAPGQRWRALPLADTHRLLWQPGEAAAAPVCAPARASAPAASAATAAQTPPPVTAPAAPPPALNDRESIAYTVSHDLRAPIRVIEGFTRIVREDYGHLLDRIGNDHLDRVLGAATRMNGMIDALLALSKLSTQPLVREAVSLSALAGQIVEELRAQAPLRMVQVSIAPDLVAQGDPGQLRTALENLLGNAWKYTARKAEARIEFSAVPLSRLKPDTAPADERTVYCLRDNGAGFDPRFAERLFGAFQRLHSASEFAGTGVGLASVRRIVTRHGGTIWADAAVDHGACFCFTLGER